MRTLDSNEVDDITHIYNTYLAQAQTLLAELNTFKAHCSNSPLVTRPETGSKFLAEVKREAQWLERYGQKKDGVQDEASVQHIRSSNITHFRSIWAVAKSSSGVVEVRKNVKYPTLSSVNGGGDTTGEALDGLTELGVSSKQSRHAREREKQSKHASGKMNGESMNHSKEREQKETVVVDVIADHGEMWIKVFTKSQKWLLMDLAREGLVELESSSDKDINNDGSSNIDNSRQFDRSRGLENHDDLLGDLKLVKMAKEFLLAAKTTRIGQRHIHPRVKFYLPNVDRGLSDDVDRVLEYIESLGVKLVLGEQAQGVKSSKLSNDVDKLALSETAQSHTSQQLSGTGGDLPTGTDTELKSTFDRMICLPSPVPLTDPLNLDCTILIALISDISHHDPRPGLGLALPPIPMHYVGQALSDIHQQIESDKHDPLLPNHIYPLLAGRRLICTTKAAKHMKGIVQVMASETEAKRGRILLGLEGSSEDHAQQWQDLSTWKALAGLNLPIELVDDELDSAGETRSTPTCGQLDLEIMARLISQPRLSSLNRSVFFHGWRTGFTTITLNRDIAEWIGRAVDGAFVEIDREGKLGGYEEGDFVGAKVLACGRERSLLGSEKQAKVPRCGG